MRNTFRHHDALRLFVTVAQHSSFSAAAEELHVTKGAISSQIKNLETTLDLTLFQRNARGVVLTSDGLQLLTACQPHYREIEDEITALMGSNKPPVTVGISTYFASRWLSPKLMDFMQLHPDIPLRIQPMAQLFDLERQGVDVAIRWGRGDWSDVEIEPLLSMPSWPVCNPGSEKKIKRIGLQKIWEEFTLLHDHDDSRAWSDWFALQGVHNYRRRQALIIPDPNVRVQAVIDGQGLAFMDNLVTPEIESGKLIRFSKVELQAYGYFLAKPHSRRSDESVSIFVEWLKQL